MIARHLHLLFRRTCTCLLIAASFVCILALSKAQAQAPGWQAVMAATGNYSVVQAVATDANGNVYITGSFAGTVSFGAYPVTSAGSADIYVAKWNNLSNSFVWAQRAGGTGNDRSESIAISGSSIYIAGSIDRPATFGSIALGNGITSDAAFVAKLTDTGSSAGFTWALQTVGGSVAAKSLAINGTSIYVTGTFFNASVQLGSISLTNPGGAGTSEVFIAKLTDAGSSGSFVWAQRVGGVLNEFAQGIAVNGASLYITGGFSSPSATFGNITLTNASINQSAANDVFITKLTDAGSSSSFMWAKQAGGTGDDSGQAIAVNGPTIYIAGVFTSSTIQLGNSTFANSGFGDAFVTKLIDAGPTATYSWALQAGGPGYEGPTAVAVNGTNIYVTGSFSGNTSTFGATTLANATATPTQPNSDFFVAKITDASSSGSFAWAQSAGGTGSDNPAGMAVQGNSVYVGGLVTPPANFGNQIVSSPSTAYLVGVLALITDSQVLSTKSLGPTVGMEVFPNPAHATATLRMAAGLGITQATLTLTDALGRVVLNSAITLPITGADIRLNLAGLLPGVYALQVKAGSTYTVHQLAVE